MRQSLRNRLPLRQWALVIGLLLTSLGSTAQIKLFDNSIGTAAPDYGRIVLKTADGGYILGGISGSNADRDKSQNSLGGLDFWVIRYNADHTKRWDKTIGGPGADILSTLLATSDGGFLLGGYSDSNTGANKSQNSQGGNDYWVVKIDQNGTYQWDKTFGGFKQDILISLLELPAGGGYLLGGYSNSENDGIGNKQADNKGGDDYWVVRIKTDGTYQWDKSYGGTNSDALRSLQMTPDGNVLLLGTSDSPASATKTASSFGSGDYWLVKIALDGAKLWDKAIGGTSVDYCNAAVSTPDGGFLLGGHSRSQSSDVKTEVHLGGWDYWIVKVNAEGEKMWDRTLGGSEDDASTAVLATADGGFLVGGYSISNKSSTKSADSRGQADYWVVKLAANGTLRWDKTLGTSSNEVLFSLTQLNTGTYLLAGESLGGIEGDKTDGSNGLDDIWLVGVNECPASSLALTPNVNTQPIPQNTPGVSIAITGCAGSLSWQGLAITNSTTNLISVPTSTTGTLVYSATCTVGTCTSTASTTLTVYPAQLPGNFDGYAYGVDCSTFRGWAWDRNQPNNPFWIDILEGPNIIAQLVAIEFRQDLLDAGKGNGKHAFTWTIPNSFKDGLPHNLSARVSGSNFLLKNSQKTLVCAGTGDLAPVAPSPPVLLTSIPVQVGVPFSGTLAPFTDPEGQPLTYTLNGLPGGLFFNQATRVISGTPYLAGSYTVVYSASDGQLSSSVSILLTVSFAPIITGDFEGFLDKLDCGGIRGWVWDRNKPNTPLTVEFYLDGEGTILGNTPANIYRQDLKDANKGNGAHAYNFTPPAPVTNGTKIRARVLGSTYELKGGAKAYQCSNARLSAETGPGLQVTVLGNPAHDEVKVEIRGSEGQPLRLQLTDASGRIVSQRQIEAAKAIERQTFSISQQPAGLLLLRVTSETKNVTLKVLKQ